MLHKINVFPHNYPDRDGLVATQIAYTLEEKKFETKIEFIFVSSQTSTNLSSTLERNEKSSTECSIEF